MPTFNITGRIVCYVDTDIEAVDKDTAWEIFCENKLDYAYDTDTDCTIEEVN